MSSLAPKRIERQAIPSIIADELRHSIKSGKLRPGTALRQELLAADFATSRIPVREALRQLEAEGLVSISPNKGATVVSLSTEELREIFEIRALLEPAALTFAFPNLTEQVLLDAQTILDALDAESSESAWGELNWQFHLLLYNCSSRPKLVSMIDGLRISSERYVNSMNASSGYKTQAMQEHRLILKYCTERKMIEAVEHLKQHIVESATHLLQTLQESHI